MSKLLIVIPAYNEEANIVKVVNGIVKNYPQYDYVVVNDGSRDKTAAICREHGFRLIDLPVNLGLAGAFQTGLRYAAENGYDCAMQLDADGQHRPEYIAAMLKELESGADIVIGSRFLTVKKPKSLRMLGSYIISWSIRLTTGPCHLRPHQRHAAVQPRHGGRICPKFELWPGAGYHQLPDQKRRCGTRSTSYDGRARGRSKLPDLLAQH